MFRNRAKLLALYIKAIAINLGIMFDKEGIEELLIRYTEGETSTEENSVVENWMEESEVNRKMIQDVQMLGFAADMSKVASQVNEEKELAKVHSKMKDKQNNRYLTIGRWMQKAAAVLLIPVLAGWALQMYLAQGSQLTPQMIEVKTSPGMTASVTLPDSSVVILNSSSTLTYSSLFIGETREVNLSGEAYFSVKKDEKKRFIVNTPHGTSVAVYGTEFNVDAYKDSKEVLATLVTGKVGFSFQRNGNTKELVMNPGQKAAYDVEQETVKLSKANIDVETSWKDGRLYFYDTPFEQVLKSLSKRYGVVFVFKKESLKKNSFTGVFVNQRLERILEHFRLASGIKFRYIEDGNIRREKQVIEVY